MIAQRTCPPRSHLDEADEAEATVEDEAGTDQDAEEVAGTGTIDRTRPLFSKETRLT